MNPIADYMTAETELPAYLPYPRFLLKMDISHTAKLLYVLLLDRSTLSQKNGWQDSEGRIYIVYPIAEIAEMLDKGCTTIKGALNELDAAGLLERRRTGFSAANRLYVKVPPIPVVQFSDQNWTTPPQSLIVTGFNGIHVCVLCDPFMTSSFCQVISLLRPHSKPLLQD